MIGAAPKDHIINLRIALKQSRFDELERHLYEVSDPFHERYGQHLNVEEVNDLIKPSDETDALVRAWLEEHGIECHASPAGDWLNAKATVKEVERLLNAEYSVYRHTDGTEMIRTTEWSLPIHLHEHINTIQPTNSFMHLKPKVPIPERLVKVDTETGSSSSYTGQVNTTCDSNYVTTDCLRTYYGTINYTVQTHGQVQMGLTDYLGELNLRSDVSQYLEMFRPEAVIGAHTFKQISIDGGTLQQTPLNASQLQAGTGIEGDLDAETMLGVAWPLPLTAYSTGGLDPSFIPDDWTTSNEDEPYLAWLSYVLHQPSLPQVISTSYADDEQTISKSYATTACQQFAQLGARGITLLFGSGDWGVGANGDCFSNNGTNAPTFLPEFPAACPYVTSVGATMNFNPEVAAYDGRFSPPFTPGGGFSNYFARPAYQQRVVQTYLHNNDYFPEYAGLYNPSGRAIPDIAAEGEHFAIVWNGTVITVDGTSCATPLAASIFALVNDALAAVGRPPLGFVNPWLYSVGYKAFNDILSGSSAGCNTSGFPAQAGWDAVTGLGTPVRLFWLYGHVSVYQRLWFLADFRFQYFPDIIRALGLPGDYDKGYAGGKGVYGG